MTDASFPRLSPATIADSPAPDNDDSHIVGILLAAGTSSRFGERNKLLADLDGEPVVRAAARTLLDAPVSEVIAVVGYEDQSVRETLADLELRVVFNSDYEVGLSTSVAQGVSAADAVNAEAVVFLPGDMPWVDPATVVLLIDAYRAGWATALAAAYDGRRGHPVLFDRKYFDALQDVDGDVGGRTVLLESDESALVETGDPGVIKDIDTTDDLRRHR